MSNVDNLGVRDYHTGLAGSVGSSPTEECKIEALSLLLSDVTVEMSVNSVNPQVYLTAVPQRIPSESIGLPQASL